MKKTAIAALAAAALVLLAVSCASTEPVNTEYVVGSVADAQYVGELGKNGVPRPRWCDGILTGKEFDTETYYWGVGYSKFDTERASRESAKLRAVKDIGSKVSRDLKSATIDFTEAGGDVVATQSLMNFDEHIIENIDVTLKDAEIVDFWTAADGMVYYLMRCDKDDCMTAFQRLLQAEIARKQMYEGLEAKIKLGVLKP